MATTHAPSLPRQTADERRDTILDAAIVEFALCGLHGTATETIARRAGISQPYIFRLFGTKKELFLAAMERVYERIKDTFLEAAASAEGEDDPLTAMGHSYKELFLGRSELFLLLQGFAASNDDDVRACARQRYEALYHTVAAASGADGEALRHFFAYGMLCTVAAAIDLPLLMDPRLNGYDEDTAAH